MLQFVVVPTDVDESAPVSWPLRFMLVFERNAHPVRRTFGDPLNVIESESAAWFSPRLRRHDVSDCGALTNAVDDVETEMDLYPKGVSKVVGMVELDSP